MEYRLTRRQRRYLSKAITNSLLKIVNDEESVAPEIVLVVMLVIYGFLYCCLKVIYPKEDQSIPLAYLQLPFYTLFIFIVVLPLEFARFINYVMNVVLKALRIIGSRITR